MATMRCTESEDEGCLWRGKRGAIDEGGVIGLSSMIVIPTPAHALRAERHAHLDEIRDLLRAIVRHRDISQAAAGGHQPGHDLPQHHAE